MGKTKQEKITSANLHNRNCHAYLNTLVIPDSVLKHIAKVSPDLEEKLTKIRGTEYDKKYPYADLYKQFFTVVENNINLIFDEPNKALLKELADIEAAKNLLAQPLEPGYYFLVERAKKIATKEHEAEVSRQLQELDQFIYSIFDNPNHILEDTYQDIQHILQEHNPSEAEIEGKISTFVKDDDEEPVNKEALTPAEIGSAFGRFSATFAENFKPQHTTSIATDIVYAYNSASPLRQLRTPTQGQRDHGDERVSPLFKRWLMVQDRMFNPDPAKPQITHIYFNNLGRDRTDLEGQKEKALTQKLEELENDHNNILVITLPADKGLMQKADFKRTEDNHSYAEVYNEFLQIASQDEAATREIKDFYLSDKARALIFQDDEGKYSLETERKQLQTLLDYSFRTMGIEKDAPLSSAQRQAVWFHFIKFELPNHIIDKVNPKTVNFSCKDAIDRGGVSSAYYNLIKAFKQKTSLSRDEFDRALHAAPTMVKARGMNHHVKLIWNAVDTFINANYNEINKNPEQRWLIEWRDLNCPHQRVKGLLAKRIEQVKDDLKELASDKSSNKITQVAIKKAQQIISHIEQQSIKGVSGKRLLLETVTRTPDLILHPTKKGLVQRYEELANKLSINYPKLQVVAGFMKSLAGIVLFIPSFGKTKEWISEGYATAKSGLEINSRHQMLFWMKEQLEQVKAEQKTKEEIAEFQKLLKIEADDSKDGEGESGNLTITA